MRLMRRTRADGPGARAARPAPLFKGTEANDKNFLDRFPFLAPAHQGLLQGHGGVNVPTVPNIPTP